MGRRRRNRQLQPDRPTIGAAAGVENVRRRVEPARPVAEEATDRARLLTNATMQYVTTAVHSSADFDERSFQAWYGPISALSPPECATLLTGSGARWAIAGGRAARIGASVARHHEDIDIEVPASDVDRLRHHLRDWHLWQINDGALRPLLPADDLDSGVHQLWLRCDASHPWVADILLEPGTDEWVFRRDPRIRLPWPQAHQLVDGIPYVRPEIALLFKARHDRPKDRADLAAARVTEAGREWLIAQLQLLGHTTWAELAQQSAGPET
jgi:hypothetical protein